MYCLGLILLAGLSGRADLTLRYTFDARNGSGMPPALAQGMKQQFESTLPKEYVVRVKGSKVLSVVGTMTGIVDNATGEVTLISPAAKQYSRASLADYVAGIQSSMTLPAEAQEAMKRLRFDVQTSKPAGQAATVLDFRADEYLMTLTMTMDMPGAPAALSGPLARIDIHTWYAGSGELRRVPGMQQYAASTQQAFQVFNPSDSLQKMFSQMPGMGEKMRSVMDEFIKNSAGGMMVKMQQFFYMPMVAKLAQAQGQTVPAQSDPNGPFMEMKMELAGISSNPVDDSLFNVPSGYEQVPLATLTKTVMPQGPRMGMSAATQKPSEPAVSATPALPTGVFRVGNGVSSPTVLRRVDPEYSEEARKAHVSGTVLLSVVVDTDGRARNVSVIRGFGMGLDANAVDAVSKWEFRPGEKDGKPVSVQVQIEVSFRLLDNPKKP